jgi:hypothetical protein
VAALASLASLAHGWQWGVRSAYLPDSLAARPVALSWLGRVAAGGLRRPPHPRHRPARLRGRHRGRGVASAQLPTPADGERPVRQQAHARRPHGPIRVAGPAPRLSSPSHTVPRYH